MGKTKKASPEAVAPKAVRISHKKARAVAAPPALPAAAPATASPSQAGPAASVNAAYNNELLAAFERVRAHPQFAAVTSKLGAAGANNFSVAKYQNDMETNGFCRLEGNAFLAAVKTYDDVPVSRAKVAKFKEKYYTEATGALPQNMNYTFTMAVTPDMQDPSVSSARGKYMLVSPTEALDALVFRIDEAIQQGEDEEALAKWENAVLTAPICFVKCESLQAADWLRIQKREDVGQTFELLYRTAIGRAFEVMDMYSKEEIRRRRPPSPLELEQAWAEKIQLSGMSDPVNMTYIETVMKCKKRVFFDAVATSKLLWADEQWMQKTPWDSLYKVECLAVKIGTKDIKQEKLHWMIDYVHDRYMAGFSERGEFSVRSLSGKGMPHNKGLLDLALFKQEVVCLDKHVAKYLLGLPVAGNFF